MNAFNGIKVFSATMVHDRACLGEKVTEWIRMNPHCQLVDKEITQSSDNAFHCITITLFYNEDLTKKREEGKDAKQQKPTTASGQGRGGVGSTPQRVVSSRQQ